jgi:hypothetical protein
VTGQEWPPRAPRLLSPQQRPARRDHRSCQCRPKQAVFICVLREPSRTLCFLRRSAMFATLRRTFTRRRWRQWLAPDGSAPVKSAPPLARPTLRPCARCAQLPSYDVWIPGTLGLSLSPPRTVRRQKLTSTAGRWAFSESTEASRTHAQRTATWRRTGSQYRSLVLARLTQKRYLSVADVYADAEAADAICACLSSRYIHEC